MERLIPVPGGRLFAISEGDGPPIVLLHAAIAHHKAWDAMVPGLADSGFRVVRYDLRSFGASPTDDVEFSARADLIAVLDDFGIDRAALVGNSRGGEIALDTAVEFPERVVAVVGVGAGLSGFESEPTAEERVVYREWMRLAQAGEPDREEMIDLEVRLWVDGPGQPRGRVDDAIRESVRTMNRPLHRAERVQGRPISLDPPANSRLTDLRCPVMAVAGALDVSDVAATARHLEEAAPNARAVVWPDVAHMIGMEAPDRLNALIVDFLAPLRPWA
jgi:3-oxoadipate enol-lactonase